MEEWKKEVERILLKLIEDNEKNREDAESEDGYARGYYEGNHDALVDALTQLGIETDEVYFN